MRMFLIVTGVFEAATGIALAASPSLPVSLLLGPSLDTRGGLVIGRLAGAALLTLGMGCYLARNDPASHAARGLVAAMLFYNIAATTLLAHARLGLGLPGIGLWPATVLHAGLTVWCIACLWRR